MNEYIERRENRQPTPSESERLMKASIASDITKINPITGEKMVFDDNGHLLCLGELPIIQECIDNGSMGWQEMKGGTGQIFSMKNKYNDSPELIAILDAVRQLDKEQLDHERWALKQLIQDWLDKQ